MNVETLLVLANAASTWCLVGLIWMVQLVHYPAFAYVHEARFVTFSRFHQSAISLIVVPFMLVELFTGATLLVVRPDVIPVSAAIVNFALVALLWLVTFSVQVPLHARLERGYDRATITALVRSNWARTMLWSLRGVLTLYMLSRLTTG